MSTADVLPQVREEFPTFLEEVDDLKWVQAAKITINFDWQFSGEKVSSDQRYTITYYKLGYLPVKNRILDKTQRKKLPDRSLFRLDLDRFS